MSKKSIYDFDVIDIDGQPHSLMEYRDKVLLMVNVASCCGFTPQYAALQKLYEKYRPLGFEILAFPCNQFLKQEPGEDKDIKQFCQNQYQISFPLFSKIEVNGSYAHPLYAFLKSNAQGFLKLKTIKWNFTKFLINREGKIIGRFAPMTAISKIDSAINATIKP